MSTLESSGPSQTQDARQARGVWLFSYFRLRKLMLILFNICCPKLLFSSNDVTFASRATKNTVFGDCDGIHLCDTFITIQSMNGVAPIKQGLKRSKCFTRLFYFMPTNEIMGCIVGASAVSAIDLGWTACVHVERMDSESKIYTNVSMRQKSYEICQ